MTYDRPLYRRSSRSILGSYSIRILLGLAGSLTVLVLVFNVPMSQAPEQLGWTTRSSERIALSQIQEEEEARDQGPEETKEVPPATRFAPPDPDAASGVSESESGERQNEENTEQSDDASRRVRHISALSFEDTKPEIAGGIGSLYLQINYPEKARMQGIEGRLKLHFTVDADGDVRHIEVIKSLHPLCDSAAVRALRSVRFRPATHEGEPIPVRMTLPIRFELQPNTEALRSNRRPPSGG